MLRRYFTEALRDAKIAGFRFHDLRHTCASHMAMQGIDLLTIAKVLGHSSTVMTQRYAHLAEDYLAAKMAAYQTDMPVKVEILGSGWHQEWHQAIPATTGDIKLLSYNKH
jgi:integrase